jgi:hypothetical protein
MTGAKAKASPQEGPALAAWDGDVFGRTLKRELGRRIVQSGRSTKFTKSDPDSQIEVLLEPGKNGTKLTLPLPRYQTATPASGTAGRTITLIQ